MSQVLPLIIVYSVMFLFFLNLLYLVFLLMFFDALDTYNIATGNIEVKLLADRSPYLLFAFSIFYKINIIVYQTDQKYKGF